MSSHSKRAQRQRREPDTVASRSSSERAADAHAPGMHQPRGVRAERGKAEAAGRVRYAVNSPHVDGAAGGEFVQQQARPSSDTADS